MALKDVFQYAFTQGEFEVAEYIKYKKGSGIVFYGSLGSLRNEELLCDYHQLLITFLSPSKREESSKQL